MSTSTINGTTLPDGEYDIDVTGLLLNDKFEENFAIRYGFVPESIDDDLPFQLVRDTTTKTSSEEAYILKADSVTSNPILFEGILNKPSNTEVNSNDYVLVYDSVGKNFKLQKLNGMIRMSKSRNEATLLKKLEKLEALNEDKTKEFNESLQKFKSKTQLSIKQKTRVRNEKKTKEPIIPQAIPLPRQQQQQQQKTVTNLSLPQKKTISASTKNTSKISTAKIRQSLKKKTQVKSSPLVQNFKKSDIVSNSNSDIDDIELDRLIDAELESDSENKKPPPVMQPKPKVASSTATTTASKRLPSSQISTPVLAQDQESTNKNDNVESDSDLGSLAFELELAMENNNGTKHEEEDDWGEPNMDWDDDDDDDDLDAGDLNDNGSNFNIVIDESPLSQPEKTKLQPQPQRELTPSGPISMKELANLRAGNREISPAVATPQLSSSKFNKSSHKKNTVTSVPTPSLADDVFSRTRKNYNSEDDEDISEEE